MTVSIEFSKVVLKLFLIKTQHWRGHTVETLQVKSVAATHAEGVLASGACRALGPEEPTRALGPERMPKTSHETAHRPQIEQIDQTRR